MNDFTKEELEYIFFCVDMVTYKNDEGDIYGKLEEKIQSMIDNYDDIDQKLAEIKREIEALK